jgi:hypothetical protein
MVCRQTQRDGREAMGRCWWIATNNARDGVGYDVTLEWKADRTNQCSINAQ